MRLRFACGWIAGLGLFSVQHKAAGAEYFRPMGTLGGLFSEALGVADNGVGAGTTEDAAFRTRAVSITPGMLEDLGTLGGPYSEGSDISTDGLAFVGGAYYLSNRQHAFRWTEAGGMEDLGQLIGPLSYATGVDATGTVITGWGVDSQARMLAFRWTQADGMTNLGTFGGDRSIGLGVSGDGGTIVGSARDPSGFTRAFRYTVADGMVDIGVLPGGTGGQAKGASFDGSVIVGFTFIPGGNHAFRWTATEMLDIGSLPGGIHTDALDVTADGATIVGVSGNTAAFIWTAADGMRDMNVLYDALIPTGWRLERAESISPNGRFIAGSGRNPIDRMEGWVLLVPKAGDLNCDGQVDFFDIDPFLLALFDAPAYAVAHPYCSQDDADMNSDSNIDFFDIDGFVQCIFGNCP